MNFLCIFIIFYLTVMVHMAKLENVPLDREESSDTVMDSPETDLDDSNDISQEEQEMIRQRRKTIDDLLTNFQQELKRKEDESLQPKRSLYVKKKSNAMSLRREDERNINGFEGESELQDYDDEENLASSSGAQTAAESFRESDRFENEKEHGNDVVKYDIQSTTAGYRSDDRNAFKDDNFKSNLQDYDDDERNIGLGENVRNAHEQQKSVESPRKFRYFPSNCCLCGECKDLETNTDIFIGKEYLRRKARPSYRRYPYGIKRFQNILRHKNSMEDGFNQLFNLRRDDASLDNIADEADYKLTHRVQNRRNKLTNLGCPWASWCLKKRRSAQFNPMHEIKLKTSSRLMQKGQGASLPSSSLTEDPPSLLTDNLFQKKDLDDKQIDEKLRYYSDTSAVDMKSGENLNDFDTSEENSNAVKNDWNHMATKRISDEWVAKDENVKEVDNALGAFKTDKIRAEPEDMAAFGNSQNFTYFSRRKRRYANEHPSMRHVRHPFRSNLNGSRSIFDYHHRAKRSTSFFEDPYEEYNEILGYENPNKDRVSDLLDNDLVTINKDVDQYKMKREHSQHSNEALHEREKRRGQHKYQQLKGSRISPNQVFILEKNGNRAKLNKKPAMSYTEQYLHFEEPPSVNGPIRNNEIHSKWKGNSWQEKKYARAPYRWPMKRKEYHRAAQHNMETGLNFKKDNPNLNFFEKKEKLNEIIQNDDRLHSQSNSDKQLSTNQFRDIGHVRARDTSLSPDTDTTDTKQNDQPNDLSLKMRNEILNCTAFTSLEQFLKSLPKKYTQDNAEDAKAITTTEAPENIEVELTTLEIEEPMPETTEASTTEFPNTDEPFTFTEIPDTGDVTTEECLDISELPELPELPSDSTEGYFNLSEALPSEDSSFDDNTIESTSEMETIMPPTMATNGRDQVKLNIAINANIEGNLDDKNFNGNGTINVKPGLKDKRRIRPMKKRKNSATGPRKRSSTYDHTDNDEQPYDDIEAGKLSSKIVRAIFKEVQQNPELRVLWPSLKNYQLSDDKTTPPDFYSTKNKDNEEQLERNRKLMAQAMAGLNNVIDQEARSRSCVKLTPDLQEFYDLIMELRQRQDMEHEKREALKKEFSKNLPNVDEQRRANCLDLLKEYDTLSPAEQEEVKPMRELLEAQLEQMDTVRRARDMAETSNTATEDDGYEDLVNILNSYYTPEYLKLQKAAEAYRNIIKEPDDGAP